MIISFIFFSNAIKVRTKEGRDIQDHTIGLKRFLTATEKARYASDINMETPGSLKMYEKYLPYAIAIDVEPIWTERFKTEIDKALIEDPQNTKTFQWYTGPHSFNYNSIGSSVGASLTSSISTAATPPGSSSGFGGSGGGGGGSGGGGGGGGGGGW